MSPRSRAFPVRLVPPLALSTLALGLAVAGCEVRRLPLGSTPLGKTDVSLSMQQAPPGDSIDASGLDFADPTTLGGPIGGLTGAELARFQAGLEEFSDVETVEDGLGPVFNEASCVTCHNGPVGGTNGRAETRFGRWTTSGFDALTGLGGSLLQDHAIGLVGNGRKQYTYVAEGVPRIANVTAIRITTPLFGLGLIDAVPDQALVDLARQQARNTPATRGLPNFVTEIASGATRVGRFGWKAQVPTVHQFAGDAYLNEMGITSPEFPTENAPQGNAAALAFNPVPGMNDAGDGVQKFADFMSLLGPPPAGATNRVTQAGAAVFRNIGCVNCHTPTLVTGDSPVLAIAHKAFQPYSDFLLHDMGALGDGIVQGQASGRQMRTAPLWGLAARPAFLHDGRAHTPEAAILAHSGQGDAARDRYRRLATSDRFTLLAFLKSL